MTSCPQLLLLDNGSLEPAAVLNLRRLARELSAGLGREVHPVSLLHSHKIPADQLQERPAETLLPFLRRQLSEERRQFLILPLFIGPSAAITDYLPQKIDELRQRHPHLQLEIASELVPQDTASLDTMAAILEDNLRGLLYEGAPAPNIILCDHGSPKPELATLRDTLAARLAKRLGDAAACVRPASMERRPEPHYAFNEPLLENLLGTPPFHQGRVLVSLLFLSPGRHAGPCGDIERICSHAMQLHPGLKIERSALVGEHPRLIQVLAQRTRTALTKFHQPA